MLPPKNANLHSTTLVYVKSLGNFEQQMNCLDHCARHQPGPPTSGCTTNALVEMSAEELRVYVILYVI